MSVRKGLESLADVWQYHLFRTVYAPRRSGFPVDGYKHPPISSKELSYIRLESIKRYLWTDFSIVRATFLLCRGLRHRVARSSINRVVFSNIH